MLKNHGFKYDSNPQKKVFENQQSDIENRTTQHPNTDKCSSSPRPKKIKKNLSN